jgi:hypothetical protein
MSLAAGETSARPSDEAVYRCEARAVCRSKGMLVRVAYKGKESQSPSRERGVEVLLYWPGSRSMIYGYIGLFCRAPYRMRVMDKQC